MPKKGTNNESYICSFHYCFPQVCLVFNPISAIYLPNISPRRRAGRARPEGRSTPPPTASVQGSRVCVWAKRRAKRISCKARCSFSLVSIIIITQCQYLQFCVNVTETVSRYTVEMATKFRGSFHNIWRGPILGLSPLTLRNQWRNHVKWVKHSEST